jgi:CRP-like cAMP-binding protein
MDWFNQHTPDKRVLLKKDGILFHQGDFPDFLYLVREGCIVMVKESPFGNPFITERLESSEFLGGFAVLGEFPYPATARAERPSVVEGYSAEKIRNALVAEISFRRGFFREIGVRVQDLQSRLLISPEPVKIRLARVIVSLCKKSRDMGLSSLGTDPVEIEVTRKSLSLMAGTSVESAIRLTRSWEKAGYLDLSRREHVIVLSLDHFMNMTYENWSSAKE